MAERIAAEEEADYEDTGGVGGTLAGNALSLAAGARDARRGADRRRPSTRMIAAARALRGRRRGALERHRLPWSIVSTRRPRRVPLRARAAAHRRASRHAAGDPSSRSICTCYLLNRGVLITPFHNMALMCPATTAAEVDRHTEVFGEAVEELLRMTEHHEHHAAQAGDKGLKQNAIGFLDGS